MGKEEYLINGTTCVSEGNLTLPKNISLNEGILKK